MSVQHTPETHGGNKGDGPALPAPIRPDASSRRDYAFLPAALEILEQPPVPWARAILLLIVAFGAAVVGWTCFARIDIVVSAPGVVIPRGKVKVVQPSEPGIVTEIHVRDGQLVKRGDTLISLDNTDSLADIAALTEALSRAELTIMRLDAQLQNDISLYAPDETVDPQLAELHRRLLEQSLASRNERLDTLDIEIERALAEREVIGADVARLTQTVPLVQELYDKKAALAERRLLSKAELLKAEIEIADTRHSLLSAGNRLHEVEARLARAREEKSLAEAEYRRDLLNQLTEARNTRKQVFQQLAKAENRQDHHVLRSPVDGLVQQLAVNAAGAVVTAAQPLLVVVPTEAGLEVEAQVLNKDIGFVRPEQQVSVKVSAYPFTRYGDLPGRIEWVASDTVLSKDLGPSYPIRVSLQRYELPNEINGRRGTITPGMTVSADIKVGSRRVIEYFLGPILRYKDQSLREM